MDEKKVNPQMPGVGLAVIVMKEGKVLLGKRKNAHGEGTWAFPGGHLEFCEKFEDCAKREVSEETGLDVDLIDKYPIRATNDIFTKEDKHYVTLFMRANYTGGKPRRIEPEKCEEWKWFGWQWVPSPLFTPVQNLIKQGYNLFYE